MSPRATPRRHSQLPAAVGGGVLPRGDRQLLLADSLTLLSSANNPSTLWPNADPAGATGRPRRTSRTTRPGGSPSPPARPAPAARPPSHNGSRTDAGPS